MRNFEQDVSIACRWESAAQFELGGEDLLTLSHNAVLQAEIPRN